MPFQGGPAWHQAKTCGIQVNFGARGASRIERRFEHRADSYTMRPSKSRSRNKPNRNRTVGNVINRVFDSSGPEGKVRGTPQQIIDKYNQLARDAQVSGDRVAAENFQQHAEHYLRLLSVAQKEQDSRREEQERQNRERQVERDRDRARRQERELNGGELVEGESGQSGVAEPGGEDDDSGLVETPESQSSKGAPAPDDQRSNAGAERKPAAKPGRRKPRGKARSDGDAGPEGTDPEGGGNGSSPREAAE